MKNNDDFMNVLRLFQSSCKDYPGGITAVAALMEMSPVILANKLNPHYAQNHLSLTDACEILQITGNRKPVSAMAYLIGEMLMPLPISENSWCDVLNRFIDIMSRCSDVGKAVSDATQSNSELGENLSSRERREIKALLDELITSSVVLRQSL